ncbi:MAG: phasin family protein [Rhodothermales bacterium]
MSDRPNRFTIETVAGDVAEASRNLWLAGLGTVVTVEEEGVKLYENMIRDGRKRWSTLQDDASRLFDDLVERGEKVEEKGWRQVEAVKGDLHAAKDDLAKRRNAFADQVEQTVVGSVEKTLKRLDVPTRAEVRELTKTIEQLTEKVAHLATGLEK